MAATGSSCNCLSSGKRQPSYPITAAAAAAFSGNGRRGNKTLPLRRSLLGEYVTDNAAGEAEWRYYQRDGNTLVRQTTNQTATITLAWTFSPEGGVILGEEGPVCVKA